MRRAYAIILVLVLALSLGSPLSEGKENGKYNTVSGQACSQCHYATSATPSLTGTPTQYSPSQTYSLTMSVNGGPTGSEGGFSLNVDKGSFSNAGTSAKINSGNNKQATHSNSNARSWTLDWTAPSSGSGTVTFSYAALAANGNGQNTGDAYGTGSKQVSESVSNTAPSVSNTQISPSTAYTSDTLQLSYTYSDNDGDAESGTEIRWYKDSSLVSSRNNAVSVPSSLTSRGEQWYATVTPSDGTDSGTLKTSNTLTIQNSAPNIDSASITPTSPNNNQDLTISFTSSDADSDSVTLSSIEWYQDGVQISGLDSEMSVPSYATRDGEVWHAVIIPNDGEEDGQSYTITSVTIGGQSTNNPPVVSDVQIAQSNTNTTGDLTLTYTFSDADGNTEAGVQIHWYIAENRASMHDGKLTIDSVYTSKGQSWKAKVRVNDGTVWSDGEEESNSVVITNTKPSAVISISPEVPTINDALSLVSVFSDIDGDSSAGSQINWYKDGVTVPNLYGIPTVSPTYTLGGQIWHVDYIPSDGEETGTLVSAAVTIANTKPTVSAIFEMNDDLELNFSSEDLDGDDLVTAIAWQHNGVDISNYDNTTTIPKQSLIGADIWSAFISVTDGKETIFHNFSFTVPNTNPVAQASFDDSNSYVGLPMTIISTSSDADGDAITHSWVVGDETLSGNSIEFTPSASIESILLRVRDSNGGTDTTTLEISSTKLEAPVLQTEVNGDEVQLSWVFSDVDNVEFSIERDGGIIHQTTQKQYIDLPFTSGEHKYRILLVVDGTVIDSGQAAQKVDISQDAAASAEEVGEPSTILAIVFILFGLLSVLMASIGGDKK